MKIIEKYINAVKMSREGMLNYLRESSQVLSVESNSENSARSVQRAVKIVLSDKRMTNEQD